MKNELLAIAEEMWQNAETADPDYIRGFSVRIKEAAEKLPDEVPSEETNQDEEIPPTGDPEDGNGGDHPTKRPGNP